MSMGSMSMGDGIPPLFTIQKAYWGVVGVAIGIAAAVNLVNYCLYWQRYVSFLPISASLTCPRLRALRNGDPTPAKPKAFLFRANATFIAICREYASFSLPSVRIGNRRIRMPTLGATTLIAANAITLIVLCFYKFHPSDRWQWEDIGYRTGFVSVCQLPLLFLLAGKNNIIGLLTGMSYEKLNWIHRWCARCLLLTTTIHFGYWLADWQPYHYFPKRLKIDPITRHGLGSWCILLWIVFSSFAPLRRLSYEFFVIQHVVSFAFFIGFVYLHVPAENHKWIWICVGLFFFDRVLRAANILYTNLSFFHPKQRKSGRMSGLWACKAEFTPLPHNTTRISIPNPPLKWVPGQHVFLSCHSVVPLQSHPFTIASIPQDGKIEFLVKAERGGTLRFLRHADKHHSPLPPSNDDGTTRGSRSVAIEGAYGHIRPLRQFDSVVFLAGSTGSTFTVPLMRDLVSQWTSLSRSEGSSASPLDTVTRHIRFIWVVKSRHQLGWFSSQLSEAAESAIQLRKDGHKVELEMSIYVTCDPEFTSDHQSTLTASSASSSIEAHGAVEEYSETYPSATDEKAGLYSKHSQADKFSVHEVESVADSNLDNAAGCGPGEGSCCCTATIEDEDAISSAGSKKVCNCGAAGSRRSPQPAPAPISTTSNPFRSTDDSSSASTQKPDAVHPAISVFAGRPQPRNIIRRSLEQALGESAVVACGPNGLIDDVRAAVVGLSDERAVHKGTGAQGIYLHAEQFAY